MNEIRAGRRQECAGSTSAGEGERQYLTEALAHLNAAMDRLLSAGRVGWANEIARCRNAVEKDLRA